MLQIIESSPAATAQQLLEIENRLGTKLPNAYRTFLERTNGGLPRPDVVDIDGLAGGSADIQVFFATTRAIPSSTLVWNLDLIRERFPSETLLPIACDSFGNLYCLKWDGPAEHVVVYWDLCGGTNSSYLVAPSFEEFTARIRAWED
jgi:hypothetical protein